MTSIAPGWYDDPEDAEGQRYWDGKEWTPHRQRKPITQPPPPTGRPAWSVPPPPPSGRPAWSVPPPPGVPSGAPPKKPWNPKVIAAVIGVVAVLGVIGLLASPDTPQPSSTPTPSGTGNQQSSGTGKQQSSDGNDPTAGRSNSYRDGYWFAVNNQGNLTGAAISMGVQGACQMKAQQMAPVQGFNTQEWSQGCADAMEKMGG